MRRAPLLLALLVLAGCGGGSKTSATTTATQAGPDPDQALRALVVAAHQGDTSALPQLLTADSHASASELGEGLGTFFRKPTRTLYRSGDWSVATVDGLRTAEGMRGRATYAAAFRLVRGTWRADLSGKVAIRILGPDAGTRAARIPQVAVELTAPSALAESGLWVDGQALDVKGGGSPTRGTIYGAPAAPLAPGAHVAVAYARTATHGSAVAWIFRV